jgi:hypothetical protein
MKISDFPIIILGTILLIGFALISYKQPLVAATGNAKNTNNYPPAENWWYLYPSLDFSMASSTGSAGSIFPLQTTNTKDGPELSKINK